MDTIVYDPFFQDMPRFFNMPFKELLASKHPTAWLQVPTGVWAAAAAAAAVLAGRQAPPLFLHCPAQLHSRLGLRCCAGQAPAVP
jgi:hypothetical protein